MWFFLEMFNVLNSSVLLMWDPFLFRFEEIDTYLWMIILTLINKYSVSKSYEFGIDFTILILIQTMIVFLTFLIDVQLFGKIPSVYNLIGGVIVIVTSIMATILC